jgi:hypothetical protein
LQIVAAALQASDLPAERPTCPVVSRSTHILAGRPGLMRYADPFSHLPHTMSIHVFRIRQSFRCVRVSSIASRTADKLPFAVRLRRFLSASRPWERFSIGESAALAVMELQQKMSAKTLSQ